MPRDKTESHKKIVNAAMEEFLSKGYEQTSMKSVADAVGLTSAALYRHFTSKQDLFASLVQPAVDSVTAWVQCHEEMSKEAIGGVDPSHLWDFEGELTDARLVLDIIYANPDAFQLLLFRSAGTPYENYIQAIIEESTNTMMEFITLCKDQGFSPKEISKEEMHMLVSAYTLAMIEPLRLGYNKDEATRYLQTILEFFTPGWRMVLGV